MPKQTWYLILLCQDIAAGRNHAAGLSLDPVIQCNEATLLDGDIANPWFCAGAVDHRCTFNQKIKYL